MGPLSALGKLLTRWYVAAPFVAGLGIAAGALIFVYAFSGRPNIGVISVPYTVIDEGTAYVITEYLSYARRDDSIKAVVIKLTTPGGEASSSERLYMETRKLREEKPVVLVMNGLVASGGYMMAMGANHTYAQSSSLVGSVGVVSSTGPLVPPLPDESVVFSGPYKLSGIARRDHIGMVDQLKSGFAEMVIAERGDKLRISRDELVQGRIYSGVEAVRLGLVDQIGGDGDAARKAAELAGISGYGFVDVNLEVLVEVSRELRRILDPLSDGSGPNLAAARGPAPATDGVGDSVPGLLGMESTGDADTLQALWGLMRYESLGTYQEDPLPEFPLEIASPNVYYLYVGHGQ